MKTKTLLPTAMEAELRRIGKGIKTARLSRNLSRADLGARLGVSFHTVRAVEEGKPGTAIGTYVHALWVLGLSHTLRPVADPTLDSEGEAFRLADLRKVASGPRRIDNDF